MYCENCGSKLKEGDNFCTNCGSKVNVQSIENNNIEHNENKQIKYVQSDGYATASLILGIISVILAFILNVLILPLPIVGLICGINSKTKTGSKTAGIILNIIAFVIVIVILILLMLSAFGFLKEVLK